MPCGRVPLRLTLCVQHQLEDACPPRSWRRNKCGDKVRLRYMADQSTMTLVVKQSEQGMAFVRHMLYSEYRILHKISMRWTQPAGTFTCNQGG